MAEIILPEPPIPQIKPAQGILCRSLINRCVEEAKEALQTMGIPLPPFAYWSVSDWQYAGPAVAEVRECMLGWDVTDFGSGQFEKIGRTLFTLRNGITSDQRYPKPYAEKLLIEPEGQRSPIHYHRSKREDIINRAGGNVIVTLYPVGEDGLPGTGRLAAQIDGVTRQIGAGEEIRLHPGESVSIAPGTFHQFWAEDGTGIDMAGSRFTISSEVSSVCDDWNDNVFIEPWAQRFPPIVEDEPQACYLCHEYPRN